MTENKQQSSNTNFDMRVTKRNGELEDISFDKILNRIKKLGNEANININWSALSMKVIDQLYDKISTTKIDELAAEQCASLSTLNPDYSTLAARIVVSNHHKNTDAEFFTVAEQLYNFKDIHGCQWPLVSDSLWEFTQKYRTEINDIIVHDRDHLIDYFGFKTLERAYLFKIGKKVVERVQHMWMRVSIGIHGDINDPNSLNLVRETYDLMSQKYFTHATPTLFNAGTQRPQLSSCYLIAMEDDSIDGIYNTLKDCALISKYSGGIGLHIHNIRAKDSHIKGTNGKTDGLVPMLRVFNTTARYVNQCFTPDSWVYSKNGPRQFKDIVVADELVTVDGSFKKVNEVIINNVSKEIMEIRVTNSMFPIKVTKEHELYLIKSGTCKPDYYSASNLGLDDFVGFPIPTFEEDNNINDLDYYKFYGMMLINGTIDSNNSMIKIQVMNNKYINNNHINFINEYFDRYDVSYFLQRDKNIYENYYIIKWNNSENKKLNICREMLYYTNESLEKEEKEQEQDQYKQIWNDFLHLPKDKVKSLIEGIKYAQMTYPFITLKEFLCDSLLLTMQLRYLFLRTGVLTSGYKTDSNNNKYILRISEKVKLEDLHEILNVTIYPDDIEDEYFECEGMLWSRIKSINYTEYSGNVYDFNMVDNHNYLTDMGLVHNSGKRNGSFAVYLEPWHPDIYDFLDLKKNHGDEEQRARDLFYALWIPDLFMERVKETNGKWSLFCPNECPGLSDVYGSEFVELYTKYETSGKARRTVQARELWFAILDSQMETGTPYLLYKDAVNKKSNQKNLGTIKSSNLCVAPETLILTDKGHIKISSLEGQNVNVWNGEEFSKVTIMKTGINQEIMDVYTDDGSKLSCTPYHNFYIQHNYSTKSIEKIEANNLKPNDKLIKCEYPIIDGCDTMPYAYTHGFFCGDGTYVNKTDEPETCCKFKALKNHFFCKRHLPYETETYLLSKEYILEDEENICHANSYVKKAIVFLYGDKMKLLDFLDKRSYKINKINGNSHRINALLPMDLNEKFDTPSNYCSVKDKLNWFAGYCDADGCISRNGDNEQLQVASINKEFLEKIKLLLQTCGINPKIRLCQERTKSFLPDGKGDYKFFDVKPLYRLLITSCDLYNLYCLGFRPKRLIISGNKPARDAKQFIKILRIEKNNRIDDTYCFTEPKKHMGIFNGILTGQCTEITEYSDDKETAVCNLASIGLPTFVKESSDNSCKKVFDYDKLHEVTKVITNNLNKVIDVNFYPTEKTRVSNLKHRPIGIGVQGLADTFILLDIPFNSPDALQVNRLIFETIYHAALEQSNEQAITRLNCFTSSSFTEDEIRLLDEPRRGAYSSFIGSPASLGILQYDMWQVTPTPGRYDWSLLKDSIMKHGLRNSLLIAPMPTASTSQILGFNECFEPLTSNIYSRGTLAGEFIIVNKYLLRELIDLGVWNEQVKNNIIANKGSIQQLTNLPEHIRNKYKIVWEIPMKQLIDMSADRGAFICQSQSLNLWMEDPVYNKLTSMHFYAWNKGLKTGIYYLRRKAKHQAQQFTIEPTKVISSTTEENEEICDMCSA